MTTGDRRRVNARPTTPALDVDLPTGSPEAVVLVLHGGRERSHGPVESRHLAVRRMLPFAGQIAKEVPTAAVARLRYRVRGWNGDGTDVLADVAHALGELRSRFGAVPVVLLGHSLGGRAAARSAAAEHVSGVVALAPWLPDGEPVDQLAGRSLVILHGTRDMTTSGVLSARYAERAAPITTETACVRVPRSGHGMVFRAGLWHRVATEFVAAIVRGEPLTRPTSVAVDRGCTPCPSGGC
jgi:pimeloyl-ACP methyl ester carboxylesterase